MQKESVERTEGHYTHEHVISKLCISNLQLHVLQLHLQIKRSPRAHKSAIQAFQVQDLWISQTGLPKAQLYKLKKISSHIQDISAGLNQRREVDLYLRNDTETENETKRSGNGGGEALPLLWGRKWCRKGEVGRVSLLLVRKEEQSFSIPASRSGKRNRGVERRKKEDGRSTHEQRRKEKSSGGNGKQKAMRGHKEISLIRTLCWNPMEGGSGSFHLTHLVCGSAGVTWKGGVCSYAGGRPESRWSLDWWISEWCAPSCHSSPT